MVKISRDENGALTLAGRRSEEKSLKTSKDLDELEEENVKSGFGYYKNGIESSMTYAENSFLRNVFPVFLTISGAIIIVLSIFTSTESVFPLVLGVFLTVIGVIWDLAVIINHIKRSKKEFEMRYRDN